MAEQVISGEQAQLMLQQALSIWFDVHGQIDAIDWSRPEDVAWADFVLHLLVDWVAANKGLYSIEAYNELVRARYGDRVMIDAND